MTDFVYALVLGIVIGLFVAYAGLYLELKHRTRNLRKRNEERSAYNDFVGGAK